MKSNATITSVDRVTSQRGIVCDKLTLECDNGDILYHAVVVAPPRGWNRQDLVKWGQEQRDKIDSVRKGRRIGVWYYPAGSRYLAFYQVRGFYPPKSRLRSWAEHHVPKFLRWSADQLEKQL